ncbi:hypothetical protein B0H10DRAFT_1939485 [Mycena sp. CBHHK59/15]|nr:hypothetical protein B0H10DRAFT_1939485 [Mycena sp. CBHHK59/15]
MVPAAVPPKLRSARHNDTAASSGPGRHFRSPVKANDKAKRKRYAPLAHRKKQEALQAQLRALYEDDGGPDTAHEFPAEDSEPVELCEDTDMPEWEEEGAPSLPRILIAAPIQPTDTAIMRRHTSWEALLPLLEVPLAAFQFASHGQRPIIIPKSIEHACTASCPRVVTATMQCLYPSHLEEIHVATCDCTPAAVLLGFKVVTHRGDFNKDSFRDAFGHAVQWYNNLRAKMMRKVDTVLDDAAKSLFPPPPPLTARTDEENTAPTNVEASEVPEEASFAPNMSDAPLPPELSTSSDLSNVPNPPHVPDSFQAGRTEFFVSGAPPALALKPGDDHYRRKVDKIGERIRQARKKKPKDHTPPIPKEAVEACEASWDATNEKKQKTDPKRYDSTGLFVTTCRHSQVLFLCNIDTPGEQQHYIVAMMEEVGSLLPPEATIVQCYDVACVTDNSVNLFPILSEGLLQRVAFVINAMHAFGHQWVCQLVYSPRLRRGMGLTDGEGVERFWSRIRKLIGITRSQWNSRRIWMIDQYAAFVGEEGRDNLGNWIKRQQDKNIPKKRDTALQIFRECRVSVPELRQNWEAQKAAQTSLRAHAPTRLKRELEKVLALQEQIDSVEKSISDVKQSITGAGASTDSLTLLRGLETTHDTLSRQAEALYASLNIRQAFPELLNLPLEFVRILLTMRDLKINIRKRAIGTFYEWETLDRAVGGCREALGTKLHQKTRKAIAKCQPALLKSIHKFNEYCTDLERLLPAGCKIPIPQPLSTALNGLRNDPSLHEDVWITPSQGQIPRWLNDVNVHDGIRALHSLDRCAEESRRLNLERENMSRWLTEELAIVGLAIEILTDSTLELALHQRLGQLQSLQVAWAPSLSRRSEELIPVIREASVQPHQINDAHLVNALIRAPRTVTIRLEPDDDIIAQPDPLASASTEMETTEELDPGTMCDADEVVLETLAAADAEDADLDAEDESSGVDAASLNLTIVWECPPGLRVDITLMQCIRERNNSLSIDTHPGLRVVDVMVLITRMIILANRNGHPLHVTTEEEPWIARPLIPLGESRQSNEHDCGIWVLCMMGPSCADTTPLALPEVGDLHVASTRVGGL